jgi:hypothetical protein
MPVSLFDIEEQIGAFIMAADEDETDEATRAERDAFIMAQLSELATAEADKVDSYGFAMKKIEADVQFLKDEEARIAARRKSAEGQIERIKERIRFVMEENALKKLSGKVHSISLRASSSVVVECEADALPELFRRHIPEKYEPDKKALKNYLDGGNEIPGVRLETRNSVQIR